MDSQDYFGMASPVLTIDSSLTFWSPFQTQAQSPTSNATNIRPQTSSSAHDTVMLKNTDSVNLDNRRFLFDLKQVEFKCEYPSKFKQGVVVNGKRYAKGLWLHPPSLGTSHVQYQLGKQYREFGATVAISDTPKSSVPMF